MTQQTRVGSAIEAVLNIGSGFVVALITWQALAYLLDIPMPLTKNLFITTIFTLVSLTRSYLWRRFFASGHAVRSWSWLTSNWRHNAS